MVFTRGMMAALLAAGLSVMSTGCLKKILTDGQIKSTRTGSQGAQTLHDYEIARSVAYAGLAQFEGMHYLAPDNPNALFLLTRSWAGVGFGFIEDDYEVAYEKEDEVMAEYHLQRARAAHARARFYGIELLGLTADGFEQARKNNDTIRAWLKENFDDEEDAETLLWVGYAWVAHVGASRDIPEIVGELHVGVAMVERSIELDEDLQHATGHTILGAYHARTAMAELDESKKHFQRALELNRGEYLPTKLNFAQRYYCAVGDRANYDKLLNEVLSAPDTLPDARLPNTIAKRRARRYLSHEIWQEECGFNA
jgi:tetratricopeptide (TPR) repeat protein